LYGKSKLCQEVSTRRYLHLRRGSGGSGTCTVYEANISIADIDVGDGAGVVGITESSSAR
jgi:hypothetical protein